LAQDDKRQVYEAIAHVISAMPMERSAESLKAFSLDIIGQIHAVASKHTVASQDEIHIVNSV